MAQNIGLRVNQIVSRHRLLKRGITTANQQPWRRAQSARVLPRNAQDQRTY